jgi:hypothetical protein
MALNLRRSRQPFLDSLALKVVKSYIMSSRFFKRRTSKSLRLPTCSVPELASVSLIFSLPRAWIFFYSSLPLPTLR